MKQTSVVIIFLVLIASFSLAITVIPDEAKGTTHYVGGIGPGNYTLIQDAIDAAMLGETVFVYSGAYFERIDVGKALQLVGESRDTTIIDGGGSGDVVTIRSDWVEFTDFTVRNSGPGWDSAGVEVRLAENCYIGNVTASNNTVGVYLSESGNVTVANITASWNGDFGIELRNAYNNTIVNNTVFSNDFDGIHLISSSGNFIADNNASSNDYYGIYLGSYDNQVINNTVSWNTRYGIRLSGSKGGSVINNRISYNRYGLTLYSSTNVTISANQMVEDGVIIEGDFVEHWNTHMIDISNTVNGKPVYYWRNRTGGTVPSGAGEVILANCTGVTVENQNVGYGSVGIELGFSSDNSIVMNTGNGSKSDNVLLWFSDGNTIANNSLSDNYFGVSLHYSNHNTITNNTALNDTTGLRIFSSHNNTVTSNNVTDGWNGIKLDYSYDNDITGNEAYSNRGVGIDLSDSSGNTIADNIVTFNNREGISLSSSGNNAIVGNNASSNSGGIQITSQSNNNVATNNDVFSNRRSGIDVGYSTNNTFIGNTVSFNEAEGLNIHFSTHVTLVDNLMVEDGIYLVGDLLEEWNTHIIETTNTVNDKPVYYWKNTTGGTIPLNAGEVILANCTQVTIENQDVRSGTVGIDIGFSSFITVANNTVSKNIRGGVLFQLSSDNVIVNNTGSEHWSGVSVRFTDRNVIAYNNFSDGGYGVFVYHSNESRVENNNASNNWGGICMMFSENGTFAENSLWNNTNGVLVSYSHNNTIAENTVSSSSNYGTMLIDSSDNQIYHNEFMNNFNQSYDSGTNSWDNGYPSGGNYWSDYTGVDEKSGANQDQEGSDEIGDTPYNVPGGVNRDRYPLMIQIQEPPWVPPNDPPTCTISTPAQSEVVSGIYAVAGTASDSDGDVERVEIRIDEGPWFVVWNIPWSYEWNTANVSNGEHTIYARSFDGENYSAEANVTVSVDNPSPPTDQEPQDDWVWIALVSIIVIVVIVLLIVFMLIRRRKKGSEEEEPSEPIPEEPIEEPSDDEEA